MSHLVNYRVSNFEEQSAIFRMAIKKRQKIMGELRSTEHYEATETVTYGDHDPFSVPVPACDTCGQPPHIITPSSSERRWSVTCHGCNKTIQSPQKSQWKASLLWCERNLGSMGADSTNKCDTFRAYQGLIALQRMNASTTACASVTLRGAWLLSCRNPLGNVNRKRSVHEYN